ncbi:MAG: AMP-binding protein [Cryobacterium sp.]|nr:AMP-binding protein [Oligoflexia bacterium]
MSTAPRDKTWLDLYPSGVRAEIDPAYYANLRDLFEETCRIYADHTAFSNRDFPLSFREIDVKSKHFAAFLQTELGLKKGDRIVLQMPNLLQYPVALFGAIRAGLVVVNMNPLYTSSEMEATLKDSNPSAIVILENFVDKLETVLANTTIRHVILTEIGDLFAFPKRTLINFVVRYVKRMIPAHRLHQTISFRSALSRGARASFKPPALSGSDLVFLQYTGGTTGVSKAAMLSHTNMLANLFQMVEWMKPKLEPGKEIVIAALPLYHVFCLTVNCLGLFHLGAHNVLITNPRDFSDFIRTLKKAKPTVLTAVSTLLGGLLHDSRFSTVNLSSLKVTVAGGMALKESVAKEWTKRTGTPVIEGYGLTEASPVISCNPLDGHDRLGTIGIPVPSTDVKIVDEKGIRVPFGERGELCAKGPQVMSGYWKKPEETALVFDADGWLKTGDIATQSADGFLKIVDRKKDMILVSGFNVYPNEVEEVAMRNPKVLDAAAIGIPDEHSGEVVKLVVVKKDPSLTEAELMAYCKTELTGYKRPKVIEFRTELPKTNVGKILRRELK